jgi:hypothetical protein
MLVQKKKKKNALQAQQKKIVGFSVTPLLATLFAFARVPIKNVVQTPLHPLSISPSLFPSLYLSHFLSLRGKFPVII